MERGVIPIVEQCHTHSGMGSHTYNGTGSHTQSGMESHTYSGTGCHTHSETGVHSTKILIELVVQSSKSHFL